MLALKRVFLLTFSVYFPPTFAFGFVLLLCSLCLFAGRGLVRAWEAVWYRLSGARQTCVFTSELSYPVTAVPWMSAEPFLYLRFLICKMIVTLVVELILVASTF